MQDRSSRLLVAALALAIGLLVVAGIIRSVSTPSTLPARTSERTASVLQLTPGPVDLEALPGPHPNLRPRRLMAFSAIAIAAILFVVYYGWRQRYILEWVACWVIAAYGMALLSRQYPDVRFARAAIGLFGLLNLASALIMLKSGWSYAREPVPRGSRWVLVAFVVWLVAGRLVLDRQSMAATYFLVLAVLGFAAAVKFILGLPGGRTWGGMTMGLALAVIAGMNVLVAFSVPTFTTDGVLVFRVLAINAVAYVFVAVGMHLLVFEDTTRELRQSNTQLALAQEQLRELATTDVLTGCYNRRFLDEVAPRELERHRRYGKPLTVLFVDVNDFKGLNDTHGHQVGDRALQRVARVMRQELRQSDYVFRWGGDEFVALLGCDAGEAARKASLLKAALVHAPQNPELDVPVEISIGVAEAPPEEVNLLETIARADERMYQDKIAQVT